MAVYSVRLAAGTTGIGMAFLLVARFSDGLLAVLLAISIVLWSARSLMRSGRLWEDPVIRSRVVTTVSTG